MDSHHAAVTFTIVGTEATAPGFTPRPASAWACTAAASWRVLDALPCDAAAAVELGRSRHDLAGVEGGQRRTVTQSGIAP